MTLRATKIYTCMHIFPSYYNVYEFSIMNRCNRLQSYMSKNIQCTRINIFKQKTSSHFSEKFSASCDTWSSKKLQSFEKTFLQQKNHNDTRTCWLWQISKHLKLMCFDKSFHLTKKAPKVKKICYQNLWSKKQVEQHRRTNGDFMESQCICSSRLLCCHKAITDVWNHLL